MTRAVVLGATGHIGAHVVRALLSHGHTVRAAFRNPRYAFVLDGLPVERVSVDLQDRASVERAVAGAEWIFHCAGAYPHWLGRRGPAVQFAVEQTRRLCEVFQASGASRVVFTSSAATIWHRSGRPSTEADAEPWPLQGKRPLYATVKIAMEHVVLESVQRGLPAVIVNPSVCIGEYDAHQFSGRLVLLFARGFPLMANHTFDAIYTGDVGQGHVLAAERGKIGQRYLLAAHTVTLDEFAKLTARIARSKPPWIRLPLTLGKGQHLDASRAVTELGLPHTPLPVAIERAVAWFRSHRYLS